LIVGLPVWLRHWLPMSAEAAAKGEQGDHARRSVIRKGYLYLALFAGVMGAMFSAGALFFNLIRALLGDPPYEFALNSTKIVALLVLFVVLLVYHWRALRADGRLATKEMEAQHAAFSVVVFEAEEGEFAEEITTALRAEAPEMPVAVHLLGEPFDETLQTAGAAILPATLAANPPEAMRIWLDEFGGTRVVVPDQQPDWVWIGLAESSMGGLSKQAAKVVGRLAEGEVISGLRYRSVWTILGYVFVFFAAVSVLCLAGQIIVEGF
jgi:hypothetical protein